MDKDPDEKMKLRIGTRDSELAVWQAQTVANRLALNGISCELVKVKSTGDIVLDKPLYELGITGIFTKTLDVALLKEEIDLAVHSLKDVPTVLPIGIVQAAVLERANPFDILVYKTENSFDTKDNTVTIATGSLRRKAQWLHKYPNHTVVDLRGNVNLRLEKLNTNPWQGAIFASAGLDRIGKKPKSSQVLDWMIPAPAQGIVVCTALKNDQDTCNVLQAINHKPSEVCAHIERQFLNTLEGGCTAPIGAYAYWINATQIRFKGALFSLDGSQKITVSEDFSASDSHEMGKKLAQKILTHGGKELMQQIKHLIGNKSC
jgi:hydroxymethylbilane synthase